MYDDHGLDHGDHSMAYDDYYTDHAAGVDPRFTLDDISFNVTHNNDSNTFDIYVSTQGNLTLEKFLQGAAEVAKVALAMPHQDDVIINHPPDGECQMEPRNKCIHTQLRKTTHYKYRI